MKLDRRKGIIAVLAAAHAALIPQRAKGQEPEDQLRIYSGNLAFTTPPVLQLDLDSYSKDQVVIRVLLSSKTIELTASDIIEALEGPAKPQP
jgi:hypothetical protein